MKTLYGKRLAHDQKKQSVIQSNDFHELFDQVDIISVQGYDEERRVIYWNKGSENLYGYSSKDAMGKLLENLIIPDDMHELVIQGHSQWLTKGIKIPSSELVLQHKNGTPVPVHSNHVMFENKHGNKQMYCVDISLEQLKQVEAQVLHKESMLDTVFKAIPDLFFLLDQNAVVLNAYSSNDNGILDHPQLDVGVYITDLLPEQVADQYRDAIAQVKETNVLVSFKYKLMQLSSERYFEARLNKLPNTQQYILVVRDITQSKLSEAKIFQQAHYNILTGLPNRFLAIEHLTQLINVAGKKSQQFTALVMDLDDFKKINGTLGYEVGDEVLIQAAKRLTAIASNDDIIAHLGGNEFIILLPEVCIKEDADLFAARILQCFREPFVVGNRKLIFTASIGVDLFGNSANNLAHLLRNVNAALYQAKVSGKNTFCHFTKEMGTQLSRRLILEEQMQKALQRNEFEVHYQPQIEVCSGKIIGAEALLRWNSTKLGSVGPSEFIPIAEQTGLIVPIGQFVLDQALQTLKEWQKGCYTPLRIAVNLSPRQFQDPQLLPFIKASLEKHVIQADRLELEITEGVMMMGHSYINLALSRLNDLGILLSMDDFGTGYSSLSYLREFSFDALKIDRSFINGIAGQSTDRDLVKATIAMAHSLGLQVIAEGVETKEQLLILEELKCDYVQGYYFSRPIPKNKLLH